MADPDTSGVNVGTIFKLLEQADSSAKVDNPYASFTQGVNNINWNPNAIDPYTRKALISPGQNIVGGLLKGLVSGLGQGLQDHYQAGQDKKASDLLNAALSGGDTSQIPEGMNPSIFNNLKNGASILQFEKLASDKARQEGLQREALGEVFKSNPDIAMQYAKTGQMPSDLSSISQSKIDAVKAAYPGLSDEQAQATRGDLIRASQIESANRALEKPLPDKVTGELQNLDNARSRVQQTLPLLSKVESALKTNPALTITEILAGKNPLFTATDVAALRSEIPSLVNDLQLIKPIGSGRVPLSEFHAITDALNGTVPLSQGLTSKRLLNVFNDRASAVQKGIKSSYAIGATKSAAENALRDYEETFSPLAMPENIPTPFVAPDGKKYIFTD